MAHDGFKVTSPTQFCSFPCSHPGTYLDFLLGIPSNSVRRSVGSQNLGNLGHPQEVSQIPADDGNPKRK